MTTTLTTQHAHTHVGGPIYLFDPRDVVVPPPIFRARKFVPSKAAVKAMAASLRDGQEQAIKCRVENGKPVCVFGFTRLEAACLIVSEDGKAGFKIRAEVDFTMGPKDALIAAIRENNESTRNRASDIDRAFAHQALREDPFNMMDVDIAKMTGTSQAWVSKLKKLLTLEPSVLKQVHEGAITISDAITMADLDAVAQEKVAKKAEETKKASDAKAAASGKPPKADAPKSRKTGNSKEVKDAVREAKAESTKAAKPAAASGKRDAVPSAVPPRGMKEVREYFSSMSQEWDHEGLSEFCKKMVHFCLGKITEKQLQNAIFKFGNVEVDAAPAASAAAGGAFDDE